MFQKLYKKIEWIKWIPHPKSFNVKLQKRLIYIFPFQIPLPDWKIRFQSKYIQHFLFYNFGNKLDVFFIIIWFYCQSIKSIMPSTNRKRKWKQLTGKQKRFSYFVLHFACLVLILLNTCQKRFKYQKQMFKSTPYVEDNQECFSWIH